MGSTTHRPLQASLESIFRRVGGVSAGWVYHIRRKMLSQTVDPYQPTPQLAEKNGFQSRLVRWVVDKSFRCTFSPHQFPKKRPHPYCLFPLKGRGYPTPGVQKVVPWPRDGAYHPPPLQASLENIFRRCWRRRGVRWGYHSHFKKPAIFRNLS